MEVFPQERYGVGGQLVLVLSLSWGWQYKQGWPGPYICTIYDCTFGDFPAKNAVYTPYVYMVLANPKY